MEGKETERLKLIYLNRKTVPWFAGASNWFYQFSDWEKVKTEKNGYGIWF